MYNNIMTSVIQSEYNINKCYTKQYFSLYILSSKPTYLSTEIPQNEPDINFLDSINMSL